MSDFAYQGEELYLFGEAIRWKRYWMSRIREFLEGDVLEVGAGIGTNTLLLCDKRYRRWVCLEPDATLAARLVMSLRGSQFEQCYEVIVGYVGLDVPVQCHPG